MTSEGKYQTITSSPLRFGSTLISWYKPEARSLPWKDSHDPYPVWISEIMLQQTTVATVTKRFKRWMIKFPTLRSLAEATQTEVLGEWEGLGYYTRARNLHETARIVMDKFDGRFPDTLKELVSLPGIGDYTANAIIAIAYDRPALPLDVNVSRILSRVLLLKVDTNNDRQVERDFLGQVMESQSPRAITGALMELGQTICRRKDPRCDVCPLADQCAAFIKYGTIPVNNKRESKFDVRTEVAIVATCDGKMLLCDSNERLFAGMHLLPRIPYTGSLEQSVEVWSKNWKPSIVKSTPLKQVLHSFTHNRVTLLPISLELTEQLTDLFEKARWIAIEGVSRLPMPSAHRKILNQIDSIALNRK